MVQVAPVIPGKDYTVQAGDSLWTIAVRAYGSGVEWSKIYQANQQKIGKNPNLIAPGEVLHIPTLATPTPPHPDLPLRTSTEIQGDILAGFNKDFRMYLFLRFPGQSNARAWLQELIPSLTITKDVAAFNALFSLARHTGPGGDPTNLKTTWVNVGFTYEGLKMLLKSDPATELNNQFFTSFVAGPKASAAANGDTLLSDPQNWVVGRNDQPIHALLNIQADDPNDLAAEVQKLQDMATKHGLTIAFKQPGATLPDALRGHEHFGFKDGISQPGIKGFDTPDPNVPKIDPQATFVQGHPGTEIIQAGEFVLGQPTEPDSGPQNLPNSLSWMVNGSFLVFRRLKQDVPGFIEQQEKNLSSLAPNDPLRQSLGAKLVGRWKSGTPVDLSPDKDNNLTDDAHINNFNYGTIDAHGDFQADDEGFRVPRFAHIRKVYPRERDFAGNRARRIIRRGVPFGPPFDPAKGNGGDNDAERGLVFVAYMSSIENKFEFLMQVWANNADFPLPEAGPDPIIGDTQPRPSPIDLKIQGKPDFKKDFQRFVHTTGTLYAFSPSISTLKGLASGTL